MKTLYLLRHAKSSWADPGLEDFERPLNTRGTEAAPRIATHMHEQGWLPDLVLCSTARRAEQTWDLVAAVLKSDITTKRLRSLYLASAGRLLSIVHRQPDSAKALLLIAHNPGMEQLAARLAGRDSSQAALASLRVKFPTAAFAILQFDTDRWSEVAFGGGRLLHLVTPKTLD